MPSRLICAAPVGPYGPRTAATLGTAATFFSSAPICACTAGSFTDPLFTCQTMVSESPACLGSADISSCCAYVDSVPGSENVLE